MKKLVAYGKLVKGKIMQAVLDRDALDAARDIDKRKGAQRLARPERPKLKPSIAQV